MINVTKTFLPPQEEYQAILKRAWDSGWMTNRGVLVKELEARLQAYLGVLNMIAMTNGTLPLQISIKALGLTGEIITTPFSYVATTSSIVWEGCTPVFVDIHPEYLTIDETKIEAAISSKTSAILATHVFGNPCHVEVIQTIADKYNLKVIYDAAHCFGVQYQGQSIFNYGDVSTCSFHATKLFHTGEGGALFFKEASMYDTYFYHHNFGHQGQEAFQGIGTNAKMSELQGAMGLAVLPYIDKIIEKRKQIVACYDGAFEGTNLQTLKLRAGTEWNYSYYPVVFENEVQLLKVKAGLEAKGIYPRRYFYPSLEELPIIKGSLKCPIADNVSKTILCFPLFVDLGEEVIYQILNICKVVLNE